MAPQKKTSGRLTLTRDLPVMAVSPAEAEQICGLSRQVLYSHMRTGRLKSSQGWYTSHHPNR